VETYPPGTAFFRIHRHDRSPAYFDTGPAGRFNPPADLATRFGTLYLATTPEAAFVETLGRIRYLTASAIEERRLSTVTLPRPLRTLRLDARANRFRYPGIDLAADAVATTVDYSIPQRLAGLAWADPDGSFDGITSRARHDNAFDLVTVAVFGEPGPHPVRDTFADVKTDTIPPALVNAMVAAFGFEVIPDTGLP
jgi:hypothetical protein